MTSGTSTLDLLDLLLVEDNAGDARLVREALIDALPHRLTVVQTLGDARTVLSARTPDCLLLDLGLPDAQGLEGLIAVREQHPEVPLLVLTGWDDEEIALSAVQAGAQDYLTKASLTPEILRRTIRYARERKHLQDEMIEARVSAEARFRELVEQLPMAIYRAEPLSSVPLTYVSRSIKTIFGIDPEELTAPNAWLERIHLGDRAAVAQRAAQISEGGDSLALEYRIFDGGGQTRWVRDEAAAVLDPWTGQILLQGVISDVTDKRNLEDQLLQAQKMEAVGQLAAGIAHDFNNLLAIITNYTALALEVIDPSGEAAADMKEVEGAAERGAALVKDLLAFTRREPAHAEPVDIGEQLLHVTSLLERAVREDITFVTDFSEAGATVCIDRYQLEQVLFNLVLNAADAITNSGEIRLTSRLDASATQFVITVSDTGGGIDPATRSRIFEPFFTTKTRGSGTGLGLAMAYGIIAAANGTIEVESEVGNGTTFEIRLPIQAEVIPADDPSRSQPVLRVDPLTILVVDDEEAVAKVIERILGRLGHMVRRGNPDSVQSGLSDEDLRQFDVLITDVVMPGVSGVELAQAARQRHPSLKVLYMSGYNEELVEGRGLNPSDVLLPKPFTSDAVEAALKALIAT